MENTYRMVMALILVPSHHVEDLETDMHSLLSWGFGMGTAMVTFADNHWYNQQGQVVRKGVDEGTVVMAKIGPGVPAGRATIREPYLGTIELSGLGTPDEAIRTDLTRSTHPDHDWTDWDCPTVGCSNPDFTWGGIEGDNVVCVSCMEEWLPEELEELCV